MSNRAFIGALLVSAAVIAASILFTRPAPAGRGAQATSPARAHDFTLPKLEGGPVSLASLRGRVVVLDFWATWCPPCRAELPWLVKLTQRYEARGVTLLAVDLDDPPDREQLIREFTAGVRGLDRSVVLGDLAVEADFAIKSMPTLVILDREGRELSRFVGATDEQTLERLLESLAR